MSERGLPDETLHDLYHVLEADRQALYDAFTLVDRCKDKMFDTLTKIYLQIELRKEKDNAEN